MSTQANFAQSADGFGIQVLGVDEDTHVKLSIGAATGNVELPVGEVFELNLSVGAFVKFGGSGVVATTSSRYLPAGSYFYRKLTGQTWVAAIQDASAGVLSATQAR